MICKIYATLAFEEMYLVSLKKALFLRNWFFLVNPTRAEELLAFHTGKKKWERSNDSAVYDYQLQH